MINMSSLCKKKKKEEDSRSIVHEMAMYLSLRNNGMNNENNQVVFCICILNSFKIKNNQGKSGQSIVSFSNSGNWIFFNWDEQWDAEFSQNQRRRKILISLFLITQPRGKQILAGEGGWV